MQEKKWYVLYTAPRAEKIVEKRLKGEGTEVFLPIYRSKRKWSDRVKMVELPLFNSYVFVHSTEYKLRTMTVVPGVVRVVYYVGKPAVVRDDEIESIKEFLKMTEHNQVISQGDIVQILGGAFQKVSGKVVRIEDKYAYLYIEVLNTIVMVTVETSLLEKIKDK